MGGNCITFCVVTVTVQLQYTVALKKAAETLDNCKLIVKELTQLSCTWELRN